MTDILSRSEWQAERKKWGNADIEYFGNNECSPEMREMYEFGIRHESTIDALATVLNAHPENPTEFTAHEELVDLLMRKGWITS